MLETSNQYLEKIQSDNRKFHIRVQFDANGTWLDGSTVVRMTLEETVNAADTITLGSACAAQAVLEMIEPPAYVWQNASYFQAQSGLELQDGTIEWIDLGKFSITGRESGNNGKTLRLTAYDNMYQLDKPYASQLAYPANIADVIAEVAQQAGVSLKPTTYPNYTLEKAYEGFTCRDMVGYLAGCLGGFARCDRQSGALEFCWYEDTNYSVLLEMQYQDGFQRAEAHDIVVTALTTGTEETPISIGSGFSIQFENPFVDETLAEAIFAEIDQFTFAAGSLKWRGNPAVQAGDILLVQETNASICSFPVMKQALTFSGGLVVTAQSFAQSEASLTYRVQSPTERKIRRMYDAATEQIQYVTEAITGQHGGYVVINSNENQQPTEILIMDSPDKEAAKYVWRWNQAGLAHSSNGYQGEYDTAILADGTINANFIATGTLKTNTLQIADIVEAINQDGGPLLESTRISVNGEAFGVGVQSIVKQAMHVASQNYAKGTAIPCTASAGTTVLYALDDALDTAQCTLSFDYEILEDITDAEILVGGVSAGSISNIEATGHLSFVVESDTVLQGDVTLVLQQGKIRISHLQVERGDMETAWYPFSGDLVTQTTLEQKANELSMQFVATDDENWQEIQRYIRFVDGNILLGAEDSQLVLRLTSERIEFLKSTDMDNPIAYYSSNGFELTDISTIRFGGFRYTPRTSGNLSFTKVVE